MNLLTAFFPKVMAHVSTIYNKDIIVKQTGSSYKLLVEGVEQTGSYEKQLF